jgi:hypothetical protein
MHYFLRLIRSYQERRYEDFRNLPDPFVVLYAFLVGSRG